ncbi:SCO family protein [Alcanivorax sp. JB21]|uniref:SCO family protein n=1 Tax=Alcanivorax limicola TaxID=2874102 RepID=UPI001CBFBCF5|nr:SCO family protein [Alcanivorax limicola]MBZ2188610.1 SCO family protein [Alcanivorax limicola]
MQERSKNFLILGLIIGVFIAFFLAGRFLINPDEMPRLNKGTLIVPHVSVDDLGFTQADGTPYRSDDMAGKWTLAYMADGTCDAACKNGLFYLIRQLQRSLDRDASRVRRVIMHTAEPDNTLRTFLDENVPGMVEVSVDRDLADTLLLPAMESSTDSASHHIFLISPDGMIFMWYPTHADPDATLLEADNIRDDLKRTLKGSLIG